MSRRQTDNRFWRIKKGEPIPEWLQKGATAAGMVAGDDLIVIPSETEGYDVYLADPNSSGPMIRATAENIPEGLLVIGAPTCFRMASSLHYTIGTLRKENEALADALRGLLKAYENAFDWSAELTPETAEAERIANEVLYALKPEQPMASGKVDARIENTDGKPEQSGWRPIETAPKDGTWILVWEDAALAPRVHVVHWGTSEWGGDRETWVTMALGPNPDTYDVDDATHWMPLPAAPTAGGGDE